MSVSSSSSSSWPATAPPLLVSPKPLPPQQLGGEQALLPPYLSQPVVLGQAALAPSADALGTAPPWSQLQTQLSTLTQAVQQLAEASATSTPPPTQPSEPDTTTTDELIPPSGKARSARTNKGYRSHQHGTKQQETLASDIADKVHDGLLALMRLNPTSSDTLENLNDKLTPDMLDPNQLTQRLHKAFKRHKLLRLAELMTRLPVNVLLHMLPPPSRDPFEEDPLLNRKRVKAWRDAIVSGKSL